MLHELVVQDLGVIEHADVIFDRGSTALTGETGAGKTLVVAAVALLLGGRADRALVRSGASAARIEGRFTVPRDHPAAQRAIDQDLADDDVEVELLVSRTVGERGSKARLNGRIVTLATLQEIVGDLIEIAGQHEHQRIAAATYQRRLLDSFAGPEAVALAAEVGAGVRTAVEAEERARSLRDGERARSRELDVLRYEIEEISGASLQVGEEATLLAEANRLENAEALARARSEAAAALRDEGGAVDATSRAEAEVRKASDADPELAEIAKRLESLRIELDDVAALLSAGVIDPDPIALEAARERLDAIAKLRRKYGDSENEVLAYLEKASERAAELGGQEGDAAAWEERAASARREAEQRARELTEIRTQAAARLGNEIAASLADLALPDARFEVSLEPRELYEGGLETVTFEVSTNPGEAPLPIGKVASGGELSRIALALHLADSIGSATTMIFDEVDAGVGGLAAQKVGGALSGLSERTGAQALVVTHLPQVAAFADNHLIVSKDVSGERTRASVRRVEGDERVAELSRMLAGLPESELGREHARELLELAGGRAAVG